VKPLDETRLVDDVLGVRRARPFERRACILLIGLGMAAKALVEVGAVSLI
jgi:hypothetical protein